MAQFDSVPIAYPESPSVDQEDTICKGCGEVLEEGKAFELAGNRWHIQCFRCHSCGALLDSDANLLLLGDGSLICNNCTYSCSACGNKIEDLAILTGDQAFCSSCFRCRNCKKKIENLRYARTSQGIFCMSCHETLMARRRKKSRAAAKTKEKALPSLPPGIPSQSAFSPDIAELDSPLPTSQITTPGAKSPPPERSDSRRELPAGNTSRDGPTLPASTYGEIKRSPATREAAEDLESGFLPMAFDPTPASGLPPISRKAVPGSQEATPSSATDPRSWDYFGKIPAKSSHRDLLREEERPSSARSASAERNAERLGSQAKPSSHILSQDKSRYKVSENGSPGALSAAASPAIKNEDAPLSPQLVTRDINQNDAFQLQEVPRKASLRNKQGSRQMMATPDLGEGVDKLTAQTPSSLDSPNSSINPFDDPKLNNTGWSSSLNRPIRGDSLAGAAPKVVSPTPESQTPIAPTHLQTDIHRQASISSVPSSFADAQESLSRDNSVSRPTQSPTSRNSPDGPPPRASSRQNRGLNNGEFTAPRVPPAPPTTSPPDRHSRNESLGTAQSINSRSDDPLITPQYNAVLPKHSMEAPFSMEEEMARILNGGDPHRNSKTSEVSSSSVLRKVSHAVKHGRSFSDRGMSAVGRSPASAGFDISSPITISSPLLASPTGQDNREQLAAQLKRAQARVAELETELNRLQEKVNTSTDIKAANIELREKRTTMVVLDTQRELVVRELEAMTDHLAKVKDSKQALDMTSLKTDILKDFGDSLMKLKNQMTAQIEELMHKRNELTEEINNLIRMKDKGFQEYESLSNKNAQLLEMNSQILQNIQDMYKSNRGTNGSAAPANGLGIYNSNGSATEVRNLNIISTDNSMPNLLQEQEGEPATVLTTPQVVNIRKGQPKKFNWRKGGERVAKNVTKGLKGAFASERGPGDNLNGIGMPYGQMQAGAAPGSDQGSVNGGKQSLDPARSGSSFGLFGQKPGGLKIGQLGNVKDSSSTNLVDASVLFGSELSDRCEYEKRVIPGIVSRCIEEVESRGMKMEGIYRKSGGSGQVKIVQHGFEKDNNYDISDQDLDIHAVTSALKQYFRKLPTPLITYDVYDNLLEAGRIATDKEKQALALRMALSELPEHHRDCLELLIQHLARVMAQESENLMTSLNLAVVFAPTIMRPESIEREMSDMQAQRTALQALLEQAAVVFPDE